MNPTESRLERAFELIRRHLVREVEEPVAPYASPAELLDRLRPAVPIEGLDDDTLFDQLESILETTPRTTTRRFFNQLFSGRDDFGVIGEILAAFLNSSMYTFKAAGPHVLLEKVLTAHMAAKIGYEAGEGTFVPGGSAANLVAMLCARNAHRENARNGGLQGPPLVLYASELSHYSIPKMAGVIGVGRENVRRIAVDERGRMRPEALATAIASDRRAGRDPFLVVATAGTTVLGAFDPLDALADVTAREGLWLHVDGALGGSALLSPAHRALVHGSARADSMAWNAHKMLGVPLASSGIFTRERGVLRANLDEHASYLFQSDEDEYDLGTMALQCGRRNDVLKLWAAWQHHGDAGFAARVEHLFALARYAAARVESEHRLHLTRTPESVTVCFEVEGRSSSHVCELLRREARALVGYGVVDGRRVLRLALVNGVLTPADVDTFIDEVLEVAPRAERASNREKDGPEHLSASSN